MHCAIILLYSFLSGSNFGFSESCHPDEAIPVEAVAEEWIWARLARLGIYKDDESYELLLSADCTEGEARRVFCENGEPSIPPVRFKRVWSILKATEVPASEEPSVDSSVICPEGFKDGLKEIGKELAGSFRPIGQWSDADLLNNYNQDCESGVIDELDRRAKGCAFIIFSNEVEGVVDIDASLRMLREARRGRTLPIHYKMADMLKKLYRVGEFPGYVMYECPFHPGTMLLEGYCDKCGHTWDAVSYELLQFARVVYNLGDAPNRCPGIRQFINSAMCHSPSNPFGGLTEDYPKAKLLFDESYLDDTLPSLKRRMSTTDSNSGSADPFNPGNKRY